MHKQILNIISLLPSIETREDYNLFKIGLLLHQLKNDTSISEKARDLARDAIECIDTIMNECSNFNREFSRLSLIAEEMSFTYDKNNWVRTIDKSGKVYELMNRPCDICNANPFFAMEFLRELDKNVDQIRVTLFKIKLNEEDRGLSRLCYKSFHTLNGIAGYLDLKRLQKILLLAEKYVLNDIKNNEPISEECLSFLFKVFRCIKEYFKNWGERGDSVILVPDSVLNLLEEHRIINEKFAVC